MTKLSGLEVFKYYMGVKLHFTTDYDFFKYHGKGHGISKSTYENRKDTIKFEILANKFRKEEILPIFVSNFVINDSLWIGDFLTDFVSLKSNFLKWKSKLQRLHYVYEEDLKNIFNFCEENKLSLDDLFMYETNKHPLIFRFLMEDMIQMETFMILDDRLKFTELDVERDIIFSREILKMKKYRVFLPIDRDKFAARTDWYLQNHVKFTKENA